MNNKKGNQVVKIVDDWVMFNDNWISDTDILEDKDGNTFTILEFKEVTENEHSINKVRMSCVKIINKTNVGDIFYASFDYLKADIII